MNARSARNTVPSASLFMGAASLLSGLALGVRNCAYGGRFAASVAFERVDRQVCRMGLVLGAFGGHEHGAWFRILGRSPCEKYREIAL